MMEVLLSSEPSVLDEPHSVTSQKMAFFIVNAVKTSHLTFLKTSLNIFSAVSHHDICITVCEVGFKFAGEGRRVVTEVAGNVHTALETDIFHLVTGAHVVVTETGMAKYLVMPSRYQI
jgi:hypothetical protein